MGEYAYTKGGERVKIGTCEDLYYLRADQVEQMSLLPAWDPAPFRFRFPWPDEDDVAPGHFQDFDRSLHVEGVSEQPSIDHYRVQFVCSHAGYVLSIPCPEGPGAKDFPYPVHRNGFRGVVHLVQQRVWNRMLVAVVECRPCGARYRLETPAAAEPIVVAIQAMADREADVARRSNTPGNAAVADRYRVIADRIVAGYTHPPAWVSDNPYGTTTQ